MTRSTKIFWASVLGSITLVGVLLWRLPHPTSKTNTIRTPIKIGAILALTGDSAFYGISEQRAIDIAILIINQSGGINGRPITIIYEDGRCDKEIAIEAAQKLTHTDHVSAIIGGTCSGETLGAATITEPAKVILISPSASAPSISTAGDFVFRLYPSDEFAGTIAARYAIKDLKAEKAALITEDTEYAQGLRAVFSNVFKQEGGTIIADETYAQGDTSFRLQVSAVRIAKPDVVYFVPQTTRTGIALLKELRAAKIKAYFMTGATMFDRQIIKDEATAMNNVIGVEATTDTVETPQAQQLLEEHTKRYGIEPGLFAANAFDTVFLLRDAAVASGKEINTEKMRNFIMHIKNWSGATGIITMNAAGDPITHEHIRRVVQGELQDITIIDPPTTP